LSLLSGDKNHYLGQATLLQFAQYTYVLMRISINSNIQTGMTMTQVLEQEINQLHAEICAGLADPKRILILYALSEVPRTVTDLAEALGMSQPMVSRHLKVLRERGMVIATRLGPAVEYRLGDERLIQALDLLRAVLRDNLSHRAELAGVLVES
jgi:ArsR family transcriptional regulator